MKKLFALLLLICCCLPSSGQSLSDAVTVKPPATMIPLIREEYSGYIHDHFKHNGLPDENKYYKHLYEDKGILISFHDFETDEKTLPEFRRETIAVLKEKLSYDKVININHIQFLIVETSYADEVYLRFFSYSKNKKQIAGLLQYKKSEESQAQQILQQLLNSMHPKY